MINLTLINQKSDVKKKKIIIKTLIIFYQNLI